MSEQEKFPAIESTWVVGHPDPVNAASFSTQHELATKRFEYLIARRDQMQEKLQFGTLALNGGSLIGLITALSGEGSAAKWLGFDASSAPISAAAFVVGVVLCRLSLNIEHNRQSIEAGNAFARQSEASMLSALYKAPASKFVMEKIRDVMKRYHDLPLVDFDYSVVSITLKNFAGAAWVVGIAIPLAKSLF